MTIEENSFVEIIKKSNTKKFMKMKLFSKTPFKTSLKLIAIDKSSIDYQVAFI